MEAQAFSARCTTPDPGIPQSTFMNMDLVLISVLIMIPDQKLGLIIVWGIHPTMNMDFPGCQIKECLDIGYQLLDLESM